MDYKYYKECGAPSCGDVFTSSDPYVNALVWGAYISLFNLGHRSNKRQRVSATMAKTNPCNKRKPLDMVGHTRKGEKCHTSIRGGRQKQHFKSL